MKISLNLLPEEKKEKIKISARHKMIVWQEISIVFIVVVFSLVVFGENMVLNFKLKGIDEAGIVDENRSEYKEFQKYENVFQETNSQIEYLNKLSEKSFLWSVFFEELSLVIPDGVYLSDVANKGYEVFAVGKSIKRDAFIDFQKNIEKSKCFTDIQVPFSSLVSKENFDFQISFKIKEDCLKKHE